MKKKLIFILLIVLALSFILASCDAGVCLHAFSDEWSYDENSHWRAAICEHIDLTADKAVHIFVSVSGSDTLQQCDVCHYRKTVEPPHRHTYADSYSANEHCHWLSATCGCLVENAAPHHFVDGVCATCGWWSSASDVLFAQLSQLDVWNYLLTFGNLNLGALSPNYDGMTAQNGELKLSLSESGELSGNGYFELAAGNDVNGAFKAVIKDGVVYACAESFGSNNIEYLRFDLNDLLLRNGVDVKAYIDELNANAQQIREYFDGLKQAVTDLPLDGSVVAEMLRSLVKEDTSKSTDELSAYVVDTTLLRAVNQTLAASTVAQYVNEVLGELQDTPLGVLLGNDFNALPDKVYLLLKQTILQTKADLGAADFTTDDLIDQLNGIISAYYPDRNVNTVDELLLSLGIDVSEIGKFIGLSGKNLTVKQLLDACSLASPESLWNLFRQDDASKINSDEIKLKLEELCQTYGGKTAYEIIASQNAEYTAEQIKTFVDGVADWLDGSAPVVFYVDKDGKLRQASAEVDGQTVLLTLNGELEQDYSHVIELVNSYFDSLEPAA